MRKFSDLEKEGYKGQDASLEISLFEYGLIWKEDEKDITFIYGVDVKETEYRDYNYYQFDWGTVEKDVDPKKEWDWVDWDAIQNFAGFEEDNFFDMDLTYIIETLISYYGHLNIFGDSYYPFEIETGD